MTELDTRHRSSVYDSMVKSPNRAMLRATGMTDKDFEIPFASPGEQTLYPHKG